MRFIIVFFLFFATSPLLAQEKWVKLDSVSGEQLMEVQFFDADRGYVAGRHGGFLRTFDGGKNWETQYVTTSFTYNWIEIFDMHFHDSLIGVVAGSLDTSIGLVADPHPTLFWTIDGGKTWSPEMFSERGAINELQFLDRMTGYFSTAPQFNSERSSFFSTTSGGYAADQWSKKANYPAPQRVRGMAFKDILTGILSGDDEFVIPSNLFKTTNEGNTWETFVGESGGSSTSFDALQWTADGILGTSGSQILHSIDGGKTWGVTFSLNGEGFYSGFSFIDGFTGFAMPMWKGPILRTTDGGFNWQQQVLPEYGFLFDLWAVDEITAYAVGAGGKMFKLVSGAAVGTAVESSSTLQVYPNPATSVANIRAGSADFARNGTIIDQLGREVTTFSVSTEGNASVNTLSLAAGAYTVVVDGQASSLIIE